MVYSSFPVKFKSAMHREIECVAPDFKFPGSVRLAQDLASPPMPSQAEVTINNNKLEEHLLVWAASLGSEQRLARNPVLNYIYLVILGHGCVVFYHCHMSAANRA